MLKTQRERKFLILSFLISFLTLGTFFSWFVERILFGGWIYGGNGYWGNFSVYPSVIEMIATRDGFMFTFALSVVPLLLVHAISTLIVFFIVRLLFKWVSKGN